MVGGRCCVKGCIDPVSVFLPNTADKTYGIPGLIVFQDIWFLIQRGGMVMWPLLFMSMVATTLVLERLWFWTVTNRSGRLAKVEEMGRLVRQGQPDGARALAETDGSIYGLVVIKLLEEPVNEAMALALIESQRSRLERFMPTLSTIITASPMLGILGTVFGIISSFQILSSQSTLTDPSDVGKGIAEALLTTAVGLIVAIMVLFPYNAFRAQVDRSLGRIEALVASAMSASAKHVSNDSPSSE